MCKVRPGGAETEPGPQPVDEQERGDLADAGLDRGEPGQVGVELVEHLVDVGVGAFLGEVDRRPLGEDLLGHGLLRRRPRSAHVEGRHVYLCPAGRSRTYGWSR
jgi:hypothetical protein